MYESGRWFWADLLKILAVFGVVLIHSSAPFLVQYKQAGELIWWSGNLYNSASRWCIPVFIMLSGAFLLRKTQKDSVHTFFKRRVQRIAIPFLIWSVIYYLWRVYANNEPLPLSSFFTLFLQEPVYYHLWFFYVLIVLYIFAPVIGSYLKGAQRQNVAYFLIVWFLFASVLPVIEEYFGFQSYFSLGNIASAFYYVGYFVLGYLLKDMQLNRKLIVYMSLVFFVSFMFTAYGTFFLTVVENGGEFDGLLYEYFSFNVSAMAVALFLMVNRLKAPKHKLGLRVVSETAVCVPGIFLVHAMFIALFIRGMLGFTLDQNTIHPLLGIPLFALSVFLSSLVIVYIIRKIPVIKYSVP
ncbi:hypothetical protein CHISP_3244 [Chitinispirillum alkaliphilum]|nr:hypothetical protein CHISP_3244 [Chitinispirillum alkaliphilum]